MTEPRGSAAFAFTLQTIVCDGGVPVTEDSDSGEEDNYFIRSIWRARLMARVSRR